LGFVRTRFPDRDPYRVWANFEFIGDDGSVNEVDPLVLALLATPSRSLCGWRLATRTPTCLHRPCLIAVLVVVSFLQQRSALVDHLPM